MPTYEYECTGAACEYPFEVRLSLSEYNAPQHCPLCGAPGRKLISPPNFVLKGDDWPGKNLKIRGQMEEKNRRLQAKQEVMRREAPGMTLAPNVAGERVDSWADAQKLARDKGLSTASYEAKIKEERAK